MREKDNLIITKSFDFSISIVSIYKFLVQDKKEFVLSKQLLRSGTSIGSMVRESQNAESKKDFIHKLAIAQKECDESIYWLDLLYHTKYLRKDQYLILSKDAISLLKIIRSIILTTKKNL